MPCYRPLHGYKSKTPTKNGKHTITFNPTRGFVDLPMTVPCGSCIGCRIDRSREWAIRCVHEAQLHPTSCFITLTYDDEHLPPGKTLVKEDLQKFLKRLRKNVGQFRYFACGEYGDTTHRPHYHAVIFGLDFTSPDPQLNRKKHSTNSRGDIIYTSPVLTKEWGLGHCSIGSFNYATAAYTARYVMKKQTGKNAHLSEIYQRLDEVTGELYQVNPAFACMSLKPGLGSAWYDKFKKDAFPSDFLVHQGKTHPVPRYYTNKLKESDLKTHKAIKNKRLEYREKHQSDNTRERLDVREECKASQLKTLSRSL